MDSHNNNYNTVGNNNIDSLQAQVNDVKDICRDNLEKVLERDGKLSDLEGKCDELQVQSMQFHKTATAIKRKYWWKNMKMWIIIGIVVVVIIAVIIIASTT